MAVDNGYTADGVLIASVELPAGAISGSDGSVHRVGARPTAHDAGVSAAGAGAMIPLMSRTAVARFTLPESISGGKPTQGRALVYWITPGYAEALGLRLREGRFFVDADAHAGTRATIVNQEFVRQHVAARQVTGLRIPKLVGQDQDVTAEIVGVVGNVLKDGNDRAPQPELYLVHGSHGQRIEGLVNLVIRTTGNPAALAQDVRGLVRQVERRGRDRSDRASDESSVRLARRAPVRSRRGDRLRERRDRAGRGRTVRRAVVQRLATRARARDSCGARCAARRPRRLSCCAKVCR